jgi:hypothetical protein
MGDRTAMTGEWLAYCNACPVPEIANVLACIIREGHGESCWEREIAAEMLLAG